MTASLLGFVAAGALVILLPGPDVLVVTRSLLRHGQGPAIRAALGVLTGLSIWVVAASLGLSALLRASHDGYVALRIVGGVYLVYLGVQAWRSPDPTDLTQPHRREGVFGLGYVAGLASDLLNPKIGVFFVTFLPSFVPHGYTVGPTSLLLGSVFVVMTGAYWVGYFALARRVTVLMTNERLRRRLDRITGSVLVAVGARLATESL